MTLEAIAISLIPKFIIPTVNGLKDITKTTVTILVENNCSHSLTNPTNYLNSGVIVNPANPIISRKCTGQFEVKNGKKGMLCYKIEGSYGPNKDPYYLLISWKLLKLRFSCGNQFCLVLHESKEPPLPRELNKRKNFYKSKHKNFKLSTDQDAFDLKGKNFRVGATMSSNNTAIIKVTLEDCKPRTKRTFLQKIRCY